MWDQYYSVENLEEAVHLLDRFKEKARVVAGATDLMLEIERGSRPDVSVLVDISRVQGLREIGIEHDGCIHLGALVTHNDCATSKLLRNMAYPLARAAWEVGSPQIRNRGTVVGNVVTASPANDTITPLVALNARIVARSVSGERVIPLSEFYQGVRKTLLLPDEIVTKIVFPAIEKDERGTFIKYALRNAQAISIVNVALVVRFDPQMRVVSARIAFGAVSPTIIRAIRVEQYLLGKELTDATCKEAGSIAAHEVRPIDDVRASAEYRRKITSVIVRRGLSALLSDSWSGDMPDQPVSLVFSQNLPMLSRQIFHGAGDEIVAMINGKEYRFNHVQGKSLLRLLRDDGLLVGTKEGCTEGECGACTVWMDGAAVMSCLVPAPRAHGANIVTIEGLAPDGVLHPIQKAFVNEGAVQCGYCTPGFLMAGAALMKEKETPNRAEIIQAFTGNLCRCTGYYKIIQAVEKAYEKGGGDE